MPTVTIVSRTFTTWMPNRVPPRPWKTGRRTAEAREGSGPGVEPPAAVGSGGCAGGGGGGGRDGRRCDGVEGGVGLRKNDGPPSAPSPTIPIDHGRNARISQTFGRPLVEVSR